MNAFLLAAAATLAAARLCAEPPLPPDFPMDAVRLDEVKEEISCFKKKFSPAQVDKAVVRRLCERLEREGPTSLPALKTADGASKTLRAALVNIPGPDSGFAFQDLLFRRYFSHIEVVQETFKRLPLGEVEESKYEYRISFDGRILSVRHVTVVSRALEPQGLAVDQSRSHEERLPPGDPSVLERWQRMSSDLLAMGWSYSV